jgi:hypothetical protein
MRIHVAVPRMSHSVISDLYFREIEIGFFIARHFAD